MERGVAGDCVGVSCCPSLCEAAYSEGQEEGWAEVPSGT